MKKGIRKLYSSIYFNKHYSDRGLKRQIQLYDPLLSNLNSGALRVLDAGCGVGGSLQYFSRVKSWEAHGVDFALYAVFKAHQKVPEAHVCLADVQHLPYRKSTFDLVLSYEVLEHLVDPFTSVKECFRVLKPGGRLIVSTRNQWSLFYIKWRLKKKQDPTHINMANPFQLKKMLLLSGFQWLRINVSRLYLPFLTRFKLGRIFLQALSKIFPFSVLGNDLSASGFKPQVEVGNVGYRTTGRAKEYWAIGD